MKYLNIIFFCFILMPIIYYTCFISNYDSYLIKLNNDKCTIYNYFEKDELYKSNFIYFLDNGILNEMDYYIVINGESTVEIPKKSNIFVFQRENIGFDFGAYSYIVNKHLKQKYNYYFFINSSVKGPYLKDKTVKWYTPFLRLFNNETPLVGTSINIFTNETIDSLSLKNLYGEKPYTHIQSMFFGMKYTFFKFLINSDFFNENEINKLNKNEVIVYKEFGLSQLAIRNNYNINCILSNYKNKDYRKITKDFNESSFSGDPYFINGYFNSTIDPYEVIFFKNNRW